MSVISRGWDCIRQDHSISAKRPNLACRSTAIVWLHFHTKQSVHLTIGQSGTSICSQLLRGLRTIATDRLNFPRLITVKKPNLWIPPQPYRGGSADGLTDAVPSEAPLFMFSNRTTNGARMKTAVGAPCLGHSSDNTLHDSAMTETIFAHGVNPLVYKFDV